MFLNNFIKKPMKLNEIGIKGWHEVKLRFNISSIARKDDVTIAECIDVDGNVFWLEINQLLKVSSTATYEREEKVSIEDIISIVKREKDTIFGIGVLENNNIRTYHAALVSTTYTGMMKIQYLPCVKDPDNGYLFIDIRNIVFVIINNCKYIVYE